MGRHTSLVHRFANMLSYRIVAHALIVDPKDEDRERVIHSRRARPGCGKFPAIESSSFAVWIGADGRWSYSIGKAGIPQLRVARTNARRFAGESRTAGCALFPERILRYRLDS